MDWAGVVAGFVINGATLPIKEGSFTRRENEIGGIVDTTGGDRVAAARNMRRTFAGTISALPFDDARSVMSLLLGIGHVGSFDGETNLSTSLAMSANSRGYLDPGNGWSGDALVVPSSLSASWNPQLGSQWTMFVRRRDNTTGVWSRLALRDDGVQMLNGAVGTFGVGNCMRVSSGSAFLDGKTLAGANADSYYDDLLILPWRCSSAVMLMVHGNDRPHSPMPFVEVHGDLIDERLGVIGSARIEDVRTIKGTAHKLGDTTWHNNNQEISFVLDEVDPIYATTPPPIVLLPMTRWSSAANLSTTRDVMGAVNATRIATTAALTRGSGNAIDGAIALRNAHYNIADRAEFASWSTATGELTIAEWITPQAANGILFAKQDATQIEWSATLSSGVLSIRISDGTNQNTWTIGGTLPAAARVHLAVAIRCAPSTPPTVRVYVNGEARQVTLSVNNGVTQIANTTAPIGVGDSGHAAGNNPLQCDVSGFAVFSSALTARHVRDLFLSTVKP